MPARSRARGAARTHLAYLRDEHAFANVLLVEQPNGDFAATMVRQLLYAAFMHPYLQALQKSTDARLAEIAAKAVKEMAYHVRHAAEWVIRLGDGTEESHARADRRRWTSCGCILASCSRWTRASGRWRRTASPSTARRSGRRGTPPSIACSPRRRLKRPADRWMQGGGRAGRHSEHLGHLLAEMQVLHRAHPGVTW